MALAKIILPLLVFTVITVALSVHQVPEGHLGFYWRGGALMQSTTEPGVHFKMPYLTSVEFVEMRLQTDIVTDIPCGTQGGVMIYFDKIEVVNQLSARNAWKTVKAYGVNYDRVWIFDKIHHEINQFCSSHTLQEVYIDKFDILDESLAKALQNDCDKWETGINIIAIRVTKPRIPNNIRHNYEMMVEQQTKLRVAAEQSKVIEREENTKRMKARIQAEREKEVAKIQADREKEVSEINAEREKSVSIIRVTQHISEKEGQSKIEQIENEMHVKKQKALADAKSYAVKLEAEAMTKKLTPEFLKYTLYKSIATNSKIFYGESLPQMLTPWMQNDLFSPTSEQSFFSDEQQQQED
mmetsp:Transcript_16341/g.24372  ORF Transcript_16341/g.24372 Transcript_16341/m.24372 type:complete len:354 (+) Transcript_16341:98-1159(+)|eukprot:CAMPEP_0201545096 /NCGR_PEP_ID=MMETSP0173_2-20130828/1645_1 /ASSEMBLY_ACC=CAM_ASM_000268 /TAXON_ID=218659 /ORGANISM="Vexillifera sp., Strain DIVA3 564/2" /LENGTH=353 /DNA_ID=CAMNT_0047953409 /DNA_START=62 /DNA_END=1123 /DNA_ORIENTATION=-